MKLHLETINDAQKQAVALIGPLLSGRNIYFAGGTAIALRLGHRRSVDLDWLSEAPIADPAALAHELKETIPFNMHSVERGTLHGELLGVRVSIIEYRYARTNGIKLATA